MRSLFLDTRSGIILLVIQYSAYVTVNVYVITIITANMCTRNPLIFPCISPSTNIPVNIVPTIPPIPWVENTSSVSSTATLLLHDTAVLQIMVVTSAMNMLCPTVTYPADGVIATRPTTAPMAAPIADGLCPLIQSKNTHVSIAVADAVFVFRNAFTAISFAASDDPALNPNHPNHSMAAPSNTNGMFAGACGPFSVLFPRNIAPASAATPEDACTTIPPAKSITPIFRRKPSGYHVQWANGQYTNIQNSIMNRRYPEKRTRSAKDPVMSDGVMIANFI